MFGLDLPSPFNEPVLSRIASQHWNVKIHHSMDWDAAGERFRTADRVPVLFSNWVLKSKYQITMPRGESESDDVALVERVYYKGNGRQFDVPTKPSPNSVHIYTNGLSVILLARRVLSLMTCIMHATLQFLPHAIEWHRARVCARAV